MGRNGHDMTIFVIDFKWESTIMNEESGYESNSRLCKKNKRNRY